MKTAEKDFIKAVLNLFKAAPIIEVENISDYTLDNEKNISQGFFITDNAFKNCPCIADNEILEFIKNQFGYDIFELNQGFYKSFDKVVNLSQQKILADKILHYMSTYDFESLGIFERDSVYIPSDKLELPEDSKPIKITVIDFMDNAEIENRAVKLIKSGVALSADTLENIFVIMKFLNVKLNVEEIANKEFKILAYDRLDILPKSAEEFLRYMIYKAVNSTLLIKNRDTIFAIKNSTKNFDRFFSKYIAENGIAKLAEIFHRYKPIWLAFKHNSKFMKSTVNKMRKLADKYHKPVVPKILDTITARKVDIDKVRSELEKVNVYKKIAIANSILYRNATPTSILYKIRNGKIFAEDFISKFKADEKIFELIINSVVEDIKANVEGKKIYIPENFNYAVPVSEKKFIGSIPEGSSYTFCKKSAVIGVHWFNIMADNKEERVDLDLHLNSNKRDIGWQNDFEDKNFVDTKDYKVIFSGDMTDAPIKKGGATEAYFLGENLTDEFIMVNLNNFTYSNHKNIVPFKIILSEVDIEKISRKYLIDSHETAFCIANEIGSGEKFLGFLSADNEGNKKFYFSTGITGNRIVAKSDEQSEKIISAIRTNFETCLSLKYILQKAGAIFEKSDNEDWDINLDPAIVTKDVLLNIFAK